MQALKHETFLFVLKNRRQLYSKIQILNAISSNDPLAIVPLIINGDMENVWVFYLQFLENTLT